MIIPLYIRAPVGAKERLTDYIVERDIRTDGTRQLTVTIYPTNKNQHAWSLIQNQCIFGYLGEEYVIKQTINNLPEQIQCTAISKFFEDLDDSFIYSTTSGDLTIQQMLDFCLSGTGYAYTVNATGLSATYSASSFGNSDSLSLFQQVMNYFRTEFSVSGNQIYIAQQIGRKTDNQFRYKMNMISPSNQIDTSSLKTYIKGFGHQYDDGSYAAQTDYTSPLASVYGIKAANPVTDDNCFDNDILLNELKAALSDTIPISLSFNYTQAKKMGIQDVELGDYCFVKIDPWGINSSIRVVELKDYSDPNTPPVYTVGTVLTRSTDTLITAEQQTKNATVIALSAKATADVAYASADGKSTIYRGPDQPTNPKVDDSWYVTDSSDHTTAIKTWNGSAWVVDIDVNGVDASIAQAQSDASSALTQANDAVSQAASAASQAQQAINTANSAQSAADDANQSVVTLTQTVNGLSTQVSNKVDTSTYNSYTAQTANTIATLLTKTDASNTYATQSALSQTASSLQTSINAKVDQTSYNSEITQLSNDINLRVQENDVINQINISTESILIAGNKVHITGQTTIDNAVITDAMIQSVSATKISAASLSAISANLGNVTAGTLNSVAINGVTINGGVITLTGAVASNNYDTLHLMDYDPQYPGQFDIPILITNSNASSTTSIGTDSIVLQSPDYPGPLSCGLTHAGLDISNSRDGASTSVSDWGISTTGTVYADHYSFPNEGAYDSGMFWNSDGDFYLKSNNVGRIHVGTSGVAIGGGVDVEITNNLNVTGNIVGSHGTIAQSYDEWLRINGDNSHTSGVYFGSSLVRTDGALAVGSNSGKIVANSAGGMDFQDNTGQWQFAFHNNGICYVNAQLEVGSNMLLNGAHSIRSNDGGKMYMADGGSGLVDLGVRTLSQSSRWELKENFTSMDPAQALQNILSTDVVQYNYKGDQETHVGLIIDDRDTPEYQACSDFITLDRQGKKDDTIIGEVMLAIKQLNSTIQDQQIRIAQLEAA